MSIDSSKPGEERPAPFWLAEFHVRPDRNQIVPKDGEATPVPPLAMDVLVFLARNAGAVVTVDALMAGVWGNRLVGDNAVYNTITQLRRALNDQRRPHRIIATIPKRGYRLLVSPSPSPSPSPSQSPSGSPSPENASQPGRRVAAVALAAIVMTAIATLWGVRTEDIERVAVLPFEVLSGEADNHLSEGLTESLAGQLARTDLRVMSRDAVERVRRVSSTAADVGRSLDVDALVTGTVQREGETLRVQVNVVSVPADALLWSHDWRGDAARLFSLQDEIARAVAGQLGGSIAPQAATTPPASPIAMEQEMLGRYYRRQRTPDALARAVSHYQRAVEADPDYVPALVGLCNARLLQADYTNLPFMSARTECLPLLERAAALQPRFAETFATRGLLESWQGNWTKTLRAFDAALELDPDHLNALLWSGIILRERGAPERALARHSRALALDPLSPLIQWNLAHDLLQTGDADAARMHLRRALDLLLQYHPAALGQSAYRPRTRALAETAVQWARTNHIALNGRPEVMVSTGLIELALGNLPAARAYFQDARARNAALPELKHAHVALHYLEGDDAEALRVLQGYQAVQQEHAPETIFMRGVLGEPDEALEALREAVPELERPQTLTPYLFSSLQYYTYLLHVTDDDARIALRRLRELQDRCGSCDAMTEAELLALEGRHCEAHAHADAAVAAGWVTRFDGEFWGRTRNPFLALGSCKKTP